MRLLKYTYLLTLLLSSLKAWPQSVPWKVTPTGRSHSISIPAGVIPSINEAPVAAGDAIGVFYDSLGKLACGGYVIWSNSALILTAYGEEGMNPGFSTGEVLRYKIWRHASNCIVDNVNAVYDQEGVPDGETFVDNGISKLGAIAGVFDFGVDIFNVRASSATCIAGGKIVIENNSSADEGIISRIRGEAKNAVTGESIVSSSNELVEVPEGEYYLTVIENGCRATWPETFQITRDYNCDYPVISPNNDGVAEDFYIPYTGTTKIYDRLGVLKKQLETPSTWDATDNSGRPLPMGTYILVCEGQKDIMITIVR